RRSEGNVSHQLPSSMVHARFGEVNVRRNGEIWEVRFTIARASAADRTQGWQTGVALDASDSMRAWYGHGLEGSLPPAVLRDYIARGLVQERILDGRTVHSFQPQAFEEAIAQGHLRRTRNALEPLA